jgi:hypothetical protein
MNSMYNGKQVSNQNRRNEIGTMAEFICVLCAMYMELTHNGNALFISLSSCFVCETTKRIYMKFGVECLH